MSIDKNTVKKVAGLARLRLTEAEMEKYAGQLNNIMGFVEQLNEVNTDNVAPLPSPVDMPLPLRRDAVTDGGDAGAVLANAPETMEGFYVVPKVVE